MKRQLLSELRKFGGESLKDLNLVSRGASKIKKNGFYKCMISVEPYFKRNIFNNDY